MNVSPYRRLPLILSVLVTFAHTQSAYDAIHILEREIGFGTRALAMGGAYAALADDYTAIYWNPAGLGLVRNFQLHGELSHLDFTNEALFAGERTVDNQTYTRLRSVGLAIPLPTKRGSLVLAFGYNRILNFDENLLFSGISNKSNGLGFDITDDRDRTDYYPFDKDDKDVNRREQLSTEGGLHQWSFGGAIALSPHMMLGATASYVDGKEQYGFLFKQSDSNDLYNQYPGDFDEYKINQHLLSRYRALNLKAGGLINLTKGIRIGGVITLPSSFLVDEVHSSADELTFDDGYVDTSEETAKWDYSVTTPFCFDGGLSFTSKLITLAASGRYRDWSQTRFNVDRDQLDEADYREFLEENDVIRGTYRPTTEYHVGGELNLEKLRTKLRGGYALYPSPLKTVSRNQDRQFFTGGLSFSIDKNVHLNVTYLHGMWEREVRDRYTPGGTVEDITLQKVLVGFSYDF